MLEYWNDGVASFGQINACGGELSSASLHKRSLVIRKESWIAVICEGGEWLNKSVDQFFSYPVFLFSSVYFYEDIFIF
jgi:hypothetical protein